MLRKLTSKTVSNKSIDNDVDDLGGYLDEIEDVSLSWNSESNIFVEWTHSADSSVRGYRLYISGTDFTLVSDADFVVEVKASNTFLITPSNYQGLTNTSAWYVAVTPFDDLFEREEVNAVMLDVYGKDANKQCWLRRKTQQPERFLITSDNTEPACCWSSGHCVDTLACYCSVTWRSKKERPYS